MKNKLTVTTFFVFTILGLFLIPSQSFAQKRSAKKVKKSPTTVVTTQYSAKAESILPVLNAYVYSITSGNSDIKSAITLTQDMQKCSPNDQQIVRDSLRSHISQALAKENRSTAVTLIDLYKNISNTQDTKLGQILYVEGMMKADEQNLDAVKKSISEISNLKGNYSTQIQTLSQRLNKITNFRDIMTEMPRYWASTFYIADKRALPQFMLNFLPDNSKEGGYNVQLSHCRIPELLRLNHQVMMPFADDSLYVCWSNEKLQNVDMQTAQLARSSSALAGNLVAGSIIGNSPDFVGQLSGNILGGLTEMGFNALFDAIFEPSKKIYIVEARLCVDNPHVMSGNITYRVAKIKPSTKNVTFDTSFHTAIFSNWNTEMGINFTHFQGYFINPYLQFNNKITYGSLDYSKEFLKDCKGLDTALAGRSKSNGSRDYNSKTNAGLYRTSLNNLLEWRKQRGEKYQPIEDYLSQPLIGVGVIPIPQEAFTEKTIKKWKFNHGCIVTDIIAFSLFKAGIDKFDALIRIGNVDINGPEDLQRVNETYSPGDKVTVEYATTMDLYFTDYSFLTNVNYLRRLSWKKKTIEVILD